MKAKNINENNLLEVGFEKQYAHLEDGFYKLDVNDKFYFTVDFKTMTLSIQLKGYGHIQKLEHIKTIEQITDLFFALTGKTKFEKMKNLENFDNKRAKAREWWENLKPEQQYLEAKIYFPTIDFFLVTTSSSRIQTIWEKQRSR